VTFAEAAVRARRIRGWIERECGEGPVAVVGVLREQTVIALYALMDLGRPIVLVHPRLTPSERSELLDDARPTAIVDETFDDSRFAPSDASVGAIDDESVLAILYTSGTEGRPKGAILSRRAFLASARGSEANIGWRDDDRWALCMPLAHVGGLSIVVRCLIARRPMVLAPWNGADPAATLASVRAARATILSVVPTMLRRVIDDELDLAPEIRVVLLGGAGAPSSLLTSASQRGVPALTTYGLTEACSQVTTASYGSAPSVDEGSGNPLQGVEVTMRDGEILVRGPTMMSGYLGHPARTPADWFRTGDLGEFDERGRLHVRGRVKEMILTGGENVYPAEVERVIDEHAGVAVSCVFGIEDELYGQIVAAVIVPKGPSPTLRELSEYFAERLAKHKRPRLIAFARELPVSPSGKHKRQEIGRQFRDALVRL